MKKSLIAAIFIFTFVCAALSGCGNNGENARFKVAASFYPIYLIALNLTDGVDGVEVTNVSSSHVGCLHDFQLKSDDMKKIERSSVLLINGAGMEPFLDKVIKERPEIKIVDSSEGIELLEDDDSSFNPHIWTSVSNYMIQVENVSKGLAEADPEYASKYRENRVTYLKKLEDLRRRMHNELDGVPNKDVVTFHEAFPYFAKEFGLNVVAVINREPESEPSAKEIYETIEIVKSSGVKSLFVEPQYPDSSAKTISSETGAKIYSLDPISSGEPSKDYYVKAMEKNLETLKEALG